MATRNILFHISSSQQGLFYLLAFISLLVCAYGFLRRVRLWRQGLPLSPVAHWPTRLKTLLDQVLAHRRIRRRRYAGGMHALIFFGMTVLFIGTCIVAVEHYGALLFGNHWLYRGGFYLICKVALDLFGLGLAVGTVMALVRRHGPRSPNLGHSWRDDAFLTLLLVATLTGFLLEGAGLAADPNRAPYAAFSPIGRWFMLPLHHITTPEYVLLWWVHIPLVLGVIAALPYGRWLHLFVAPLSIALQPERPMGALEPVSMAQVEDTGRIGLGSLSDFDRWQLLSLDACMECGRCTDACPANAVGKELNPKQIVLDLRRLLAHSKDDQSTDVISDESLWACTNCHACVRECPALIRHVDILDGIRRYRVAEGRLAGTGASMLRKLTSRENPWGLPADQRLNWAEGLDLTTATREDGREVLLWVGCAGAFDPQAQRTVRALAQLLKLAGVRYAVLGSQERCTGDPARRTGDEFLYQQLAGANIATLNGVEAKRIVTSCPHCFNTLKNEYPQFDGNYEVLHHTQLLSQLVEEGRLKLQKGYTESVTYHDPCFLARVNRETLAPRSLLNAAQQSPLIEVERRESKTFCCGAGGGRMWMEEPPNRRPGLNRAQELLATGAKTIAVGCPFCKIMISDSIAQAANVEGREKREEGRGQTANDAVPPVMDVAEVMLAALANAEI